MEIDNEYCEKYCKGYRDTGGRCLADGRCDAYWEYQKQKGTKYQKQKGTMTNFNQDYKITISGDLNGNAYWGLLRKGEPAVCNEDEIRMVAQVLGELKEKIDKQYPPNGKV